MDQFIVGAIAIVAGLIAVVFREGLARGAMQFQKKAFGYHIRERDIQTTRWGYLVVGCLFICWGIAKIIGLFPEK